MLEASRAGASHVDASARPPRDVGQHMRLLSFFARRVASGVANVAESSGDNLVLKAPHDSLASALSLYRNNVFSAGIVCI